MRNPFKDFKRQLPKWVPKNTGKRYYHRAFVVSHINPDIECTFVFTSKEKAEAWKKATEASLTMPEVILDKIERNGRDGFML